MNIFTGKTGDAVRITYRGCTVEGVVSLASPNGKSLMLAFDSILGNYVGSMPVVWAGDCYQDLITGQDVAVEIGERG